MISEEVKIKHKGGRPRKETKKEIIKGMRFSKVEYNLVKIKAQNAGMKVTVYIRQMALQRKITAGLNDEEKHFVRQLIGMANNLNQLTKKAHQESVFTILPMLEIFRKIVDDLLEKMKQ